MKNVPPGNAEPQLGTNAGPADVDAKLGLGAPKGWYSRGYLPHRDELHLCQSITFRQNDSLPQQKLRQLNAELENLAEDQRERHRRTQIEAWLDAGMGSCALAHPKVAAVMQETLLHHEGARYVLHAWCIMPNHVHVLIQPMVKLATIVQSWKSFTGRWVRGHNAELELSVPTGRFWMREYWDRYIRNDQHFQNVVSYIHENPVKAGFCRQPKDWKWSSASKQTHSLKKEKKGQMQQIFSSSEEGDA